MFAEKLIAETADLGQKAVAIIDNSTVQAFTRAYRAAWENKPMKLIYGMECNLPDMQLVVLAKNKIGQENLYKISGEVNLTKAKIAELRNGLIVGSGSETGELYRAIAAGKTEYELVEIARFYDYPEICHTMPRENVLKIIRLGTQLDIPVCAAGNVYYCRDEEIISHILLGDEPRYVDEENAVGLSLRETGEMLELFRYLGEEKAYEVVVTNTNRIADMIDKMSPLPGYSKQRQLVGREEAKSTRLESQKLWQIICKYLLRKVKIMKRKTALVLSAVIAAVSLVGCSGSSSFRQATIQAPRKTAAQTVWQK